MTVPGDHGRVRIYEALRTAHLERFHTLEPAAVLYASRSYDFDVGLLEGLDACQFAGSRDLFARLLRRRVTEIEINEPLMLSAVKYGLVAVLAVRIRGFVTRRRTVVVSYAIENKDPFLSPNPRLRSWWRRRLFALAVRVVTGQVDRLALGTPGAREAYAPLLRRFAGEVRLVPALPTACEVCPEPSAAEAGRDVLFLGAFDDRKGLRQLLEAWPRVVAQIPDARLRILGKGKLEELAVDAAGARAEVSLSLDPSRTEIHHALRDSKVLVLMSQPTRNWREQVGLPIVEGLSHGCMIVTSTETGIASWLADHGHQVLDAHGTSVEELAGGVAGALASTRLPQDVLADLPSVDGRLAADRWMFPTPE